MFRGLSTLARLTPAALAPAVALCDEKSARGALADLIDKSEARRGDGTSLGPTMVRLAWHSAGTFCAKTGTGGSDGGRMKYCPESAWGANAGLADVRKVVEKVAKDHGLTRADAYTLAGVVAVAHMGGPEVPWAAGRSDAADGSTSPPDGRLPDADKGSLGGTVAHLRAIQCKIKFRHTCTPSTPRLLDGVVAQARSSTAWGSTTATSSRCPARTRSVGATRRLQGIGARGPSRRRRSPTSTSAYCWRRPGP